MASKKRTLIDYHYLHIEDGALIRLQRFHRPNKKRTPKYGHYMFDKFHITTGKFETPPENLIIAERLFNKCIYLGSTKPVTNDSNNPPKGSVSDE